MLFGFAPPYKEAQGGGKICTIFKNIFGGLVPGFVSWVLGIVCWVLGFVFWVLGFVFWVLGFDFWVLGFVFWARSENPGKWAASPAFPDYGKCRGRDQFEC